MKKHVIILVASFILLFTGCGEKQDSLVDSNNSTPDASNVPVEVQRLLDNYAVNEEIPLSEIALTSSDFDYSHLTDSMYDVYIVVFLWGKLLNVSPPADVPTDWSGSLSVNGPSLVNAVGPIDFERGQDSFIPDNVTSSESWASLTENDFDGAVFLVSYDKITPTFAPQVLTFNTPPITLEYNFSQLVHLYAFYQVDLVNSVAVYARKIRLHHCREGYFTGDWRKSDTSDFTGYFQGLWFAHNGDTIGVFSGNFWKTNEGAQLLEGWISGLYTDQVIAELHGHWFFDDYRMCPMCGAGHGQIKGRFKVLDSDEHGFFRGEFGDFSLPPNDRIMPLHGRWYLDCVNIVPDDNPASN